MIIWHNEVDTPAPRRVRAGERYSISVGTWPIEPDQAVWVCHRVCGGSDAFERVTANWIENRSSNSYWRAELGPFRKGVRIEYWIEGTSRDGTIKGPVSGPFVVEPRLWLALIWHQHQPLYRDLGLFEPKGSYSKPWVRLHALRDYYSMAALAVEQPGVHVTFNLTPILLWQIDDYVDGGATDRALELSSKPAEALSSPEREELLESFFDADWHNQIFIHPRYRELFAKRSARQPFTAQDLRDLQMWFNLAWFGKEFREGTVPLVTGTVASVRRFVEQGRGFAHADVLAMIEEQFKILSAVIPLHRVLQEAGSIEVTTTPLCHPILPLLIDTDQATIDRPGATHPARFSHAEDAEGQVAAAVADYEHHFGTKPRGMWPAEGAVSQSIIPILASHGIAWIASDQGVLARSGKWGYRADLPDVLCRPYRLRQSGAELRALFRATGPSDAIGFQLQWASDYEAAARDLLERCLADAMRDFGPDQDDRILTIVLDGENAWGSYRDDGRQFLRALYRALAEHPAIQTVTPSEYLAQRAATGAQENRLYELFTGSWIDEAGSLPGVDLGTWIGEAEENRAWELLGRVRTAVDGSVLTDRARLALYAAEGSDWFWWFGDDQNSGSDQEFDDLFRLHLSNTLRLAGREVPAELAIAIVPHASVWTFARQLDAIRRSDRLVVRTNCPGSLDWWLDAEERPSAVLVPVGGVMAGAHRYEVTLGPFAESARQVIFRFRCAHPACACHDLCCAGQTQRVDLH